MTRRAQKHYLHLPTWLQAYAKERGYRYDRYSTYHMRIMDGGLVCFDAWTTGKYYVVETNYNLLEASVIERGCEKGALPLKKKELYRMLDKLFNPLEFA